jgi:hypothetical protein
MTERQHEEELLSELLDLPENENEMRSGYQATHQPILTRREEQELLRAANQVGTPTLAAEEFEPQQNSAPGSFISDIIGVARKYPLLAIAAAGGIALLAARRRR